MSLSLFILVPRPVPRLVCQTQPSFLFHLVPVVELRIPRLSISHRHCCHLLLQGTLFGTDLIALQSQLVRPSNATSLIAHFFAVSDWTDLPFSESDSSALVLFLWILEQSPADYGRPSLRVSTRHCATTDPDTANHVSPGFSSTGSRLPYHCVSACHCDDPDTPVPEQRSPGARLPLLLLPLPPCAGPSVISGRWYF